ncbi:hypothetical conserved protein [Candidatus Nitrosoglobus terrae]|uniref:Hypothetical conserved protein n=1 Tax=Candidatus Nitrosoglobus terrae TaxID=1630141 RepID=A0A1Q2SLF0_9GAMM|nr:DUF29 domain-containing protein [Candidatus Nitrosoglobus terrae]BAW79954.1 hypothetical conserved protein [Candidatus Nitrosoglobus terrae]
MSTYKTDFYGWTQETAKLLRQGRFTEVDMGVIIEEIEDMGKNQLEQLENRLRLIVLIAHLLKWQYRPDFRSNSWRGTIVEQRSRIRKLIKKNPSLKPELEATILESYAETNLDLNRFLAAFEHTGWTVEQVLDKAFYPQD